MTVANNRVAFSLQGNNSNALPRVYSGVDFIMHAGDEVHTDVSTCMVILIDKLIMFMR